MVRTFRVGSFGVGSTALVAALSCAALTGCPGGTAEPGAPADKPAEPVAEPPKPGAATPEEAYALAKKAAEGKDWKGFYELTAPASRDKLLGGVVFGSAFMAAFSQDPADKASVEELGKKHGATLPESNRKEPGEDPEKTMLALVANVKDKPACFADFMGWMQSNAEDDQMKVRMGALERVTITGDTAQGFDVMALPDGKKEEKPLEFKRVDGRWFIDMTGK